jgi:LEA14-like dessication related protein
MYKSSLPAVIWVMCAAAVTFGAVQNPTVTYRSMDAANISPEGFTFNLNIEVNNPNAFSIPLGETTYALKFGDVPILQGRARPVGEIPANGTLPLTLGISLSWANVLGAEEVIRHNGGNIPFTVEGRLGFDMNVPQLLIFKQPLRVPLRYSGVVPVRELLKDPSLLLRSPAVARLAQIAVGLIFHPQTQPVPAAPSSE